MTSGSSPQALLGVEACARGALEAGVRLATGYPGTPATPALEYLLANAPEHLTAEWAVNEKVALEIAAGHSWAGQRSFVAMKMSGLNVASDALLSIATSGTVGGLVIYVGDDPGVYYGMVEQDSRLYARLGFLPMVEPGEPDEARRMVRHAFEVSEACETPVLVRGTTTTAYTWGPVAVEVPERSRRSPRVPFDIDRYTKAGAARCRAQHRDALDRLGRAGRLLDRWNRETPGTVPLGVIAPASVWGYVEEAVAGLPEAERPHLLRLAVVHPLPEERLLGFLSRCRRVLVVEELDPLIEERVRALAAELPTPPRVLGKRQGVLPEVGDLDPDLVAAAIDLLLDRDPRSVPAPPPPKSSFAPRVLTFCPGCPHRSAYVALERAIARAGFAKDEVVVTGDIGCTILGMNPPHDLCRTEVAMGSSIALAEGFVRAGVDRPVVAVLGDSTFFHAGIPPLLDAASKGLDLTVLVLDNHHAAMTGFQPSLTQHRPDPGTPAHPLSIEELARAARVRRVRKALPYFTGRLSRVLASALRSPGVQVVVAEAPCVRRLRGRTVMPHAVRADRCTGVDSCSPSCLEAVNCPALDLDEATGKARIDAARCMGCGLCAEACGRRAIRRNLRARRIVP
ncbi:MULTISPECIES: indolepyruvate ferredoxin oxidoreductase subunit alpha [Deferrisoma]